MLGLVELLSDTDGQFSDSLLIGYGALTADQIVLSDSTLVGYGSLTSDQLIIADSMNAGYGALLADNEGPNWNDSIAELLSMAEILTDR